MVRLLEPEYRNAGTNLLAPATQKRILADCRKRVDADSLCGYYEHDFQKTCLTRVGCWCIPRVNELLGLSMRPGLAGDTSQPPQTSAAPGLPVRGTAAFTLAPEPLPPGWPKLVRHTL